MRESREVEAVVLDWAGTTIDHGSRAPVEVFREVFRREGVEVTESEARGPMGRAKRDHIAAVLEIPRVAAEWAAVKGRPPEESDVDRMYASFLPLQREILGRHVEVIPGVIDAIAECRRRGLRVGSSTGYTRELMDVVEPLAAAAGYAPDAVVCADEVPAGRPAPDMIERNAELLGLDSTAGIVKVDDTLVGIEAGRRAGCWTVGVCRTGNALGLSLETVASLPPNELVDRLVAIHREFKEAGADFVIDDLGELPAVLDALALRVDSETTATAHIPNGSLS